ncbi:MAG: hypothetical protein LAT56_03645 [Wenzhouxiangella sp.]|nr:hypothetical protein [Wenzhouxiangella sp.]
MPAIKSLKMLYSLTKAQVVAVTVTPSSGLTEAEPNPVVLMHWAATGALMPKSKGNSNNQIHEYEAFIPHSWYQPRHFFRESPEQNAKPLRSLRYGSKRSAKTTSCSPFR